MSHATLSAYLGQRSLVDKNILSCCLVPVMFLECPHLILVICTLVPIFLHKLRTSEGQLHFALVHPYLHRVAFLLKETSSSFLSKNFSVAHVAAALGLLQLLACRLALFAISADALKLAQLPLLVLVLLECLE